MNASPPQPKARLLQVLGVAFGVAVIIGNTIGVGILRTPGEIAKHLPSTPFFLGVWVVGGLYALLGALSLAELGTMTPKSGGQYVFVRRGLGAYPGFIVGWSDWISTSGTTGFISIVFSEYLIRLVPSLAGRQTYLSIGVLLAFTIILWQGIKAGDRTQQATSLLKAVGLFGLAALCLVLPVRTPPTPVELQLPHGLPLLTAFIVSLQAVIYTYDGWSGVLYFSGEVKDPARDIPRSMMAGVWSVIVIYLLLNLAYLRVVPVGAMAGDPFVAGTAARAIFGATGDMIVSIVVVIGVLSAINANLLMASRVPHAMAVDGFLPVAATAVSESGSPRVTLVASAIVSATFILTGTLDQVLALVAFFFVANYTLSFTSLFVLRRREPDAPRPYRVPGYPWVTVLALAGSVGFLVAGFVADTRNSVRSLIILAASFPVFLVFQRWGRKIG